VYAVGDVHGCLDRLRALHGRITEDLAERPTREAILVHLGDYVDRGPDSAGVLAHLMAGTAPQGITATVNLLGNHEAMMLDALERRDETSVDLWLRNGAFATLASFGLEQAIEPARWAARLSPEPVTFLRGLAPMHRIGPYVFVHAGIRPGVGLEAQSREDVIWIRDPFLSHAAPLEAVVVHGHTPAHAPVVRPNRIGIDTGAVMGGTLTCAVLEQDRVGFLSA